MGALLWEIAIRRRREASLVVPSLRWDPKHGDGPLLVLLSYMRLGLEDTDQKSGSDSLVEPDSLSFDHIPSMPVRIIVLAAVT